MKIKYIKSNFRTYDVRISVVKESTIRFIIMFQSEADTIFRFSAYDIDSLIALLLEMTCIGKENIIKGLRALKSGRYTDVLYYYPYNDGLPF